MGWVTPLNNHVIHSVGPSSKYCTWAGLGIHVGEVSEVLYGIRSRNRPDLIQNPLSLGLEKIFGCCSLTPPSVLKQWKKRARSEFWSRTIGSILDTENEMKELDEAFIGMDCNAATAIRSTAWPEVARSSILRAFLVDDLVGQHPQEIWFEQQALQASHCCPPRATSHFC